MEYIILYKLFIVCNGTNQEKEFLIFCGMMRWDSGILPHLLIRNEIAEMPLFKMPEIVM
jgi:hypothetical protein